MKRYLLLWLLSILFCACVARPEGTLRELDLALKDKALYEQAFLKRINLLRQVSQEQDEPQRCYGINQRIAREYRSYSMDSALLYINKNLEIAQQLGRADWLIESQLMRADQYTTGGYLLEAVELMSKLANQKIPVALEHYYYEVLHHLATEKAIHSVDWENKFQYGDEGRRYREILLEMADPGSVEWFNLKREESCQSGNRSKAAEYARQMMILTDPGTHKRAEAAFLLQDVLDSSDSERFQLLIESAVADIVSATRDYESLNVIAQTVFARGDVRRAYDYSVRHCMDDALRFNGQMRTWRIAQFILKIEQTHELNERSHRQGVALVAIIIAILLAFVVVLFIILYRRQKRLLGTQRQLEYARREAEARSIELDRSNLLLTELNARLQEADRVKQESILSFLGILSENITQMSQMKNRILRNLKTGHVKYVIEQIEMEPPIEDDISDFYRMFDQTFIGLYPHFVEDVNALLKEESAFHPTKDILTPELRILGLIKLGISDSHKIAVLLHYSTNTVYNYRAKVKNAAKGDRELFEEAVRGL